jgi:FHA domain-containing protein
MHALRAALTATVILALPALAYSQASYIIPGAKAPRDPLPRFTIAPRGGGLAPIGLPLPRIGLDPAPNAPSAPNAPHAPVYYWPMMVFYVPPAVVAPPPPPAPEPKPAEPPVPGRIVLEIQPAAAQIFADGYYVGTPDDFSAARGGRLIEAGVHRLDVSAPGYESAVVDLRVAPGQLLTYRATLKGLAPPVAVPPSTFYLIPGCYMGNIPPKDAQLPASCDQTRAVTWRP